MNFGAIKSLWLKALSLVLDHKLTTGIVGVFLVVLISTYFAMAQLGTLPKSLKPASVFHNAVSVVSGIAPNGPSAPIPNSKSTSSQAKSPSDKSQQPSPTAPQTSTSPNTSHPTSSTSPPSPTPLPTQAQIAAGWMVQYSGLLDQLLSDAGSVQSDEASNNSSAELNECQVLMTDSTNDLNNSDAAPAFDSQAYQNWYAGLHNLQTAAFNCPKALANPPQPVAQQAMPIQLQTGINALNAVKAEMQNIIGS